VKALERMARINKMPKPSRAQLFQAVRRCHHQDANDHDHDEIGSMMPTENTKEDIKPDEVQIDSDKPKQKLTLKTEFIGLLTNCKSLLSTKELRKISFTVWALFISVAFVYYGFAFSVNLTSNPYLLVALG